MQLLIYSGYFNRLLEGIKKEPGPARHSRQHISS